MYGHIPMERREATVIFISNCNLCRSQYAYLKRRLVETTLHDAVGTIEDALDGKDDVLAVVFGLRGNFLSSILDALQEMGPGEIITEWARNMR